MKEFRLVIQLDNAAFHGEAGPFEVGRLLDDLSEHINTHGTFPNKMLTDANGNTCGSAYVVVDVGGSMVPVSGSEEGGADDKGQG